MEINNMLSEYTTSVRQAINISNLRKAMHQDAQSAATLINGLQEVNAKLMESSVTPHKGNSIDVRL